MDTSSQFQQLILGVIQDCAALIHDPDYFEIVLTKMEVLEEGISFLIQETNVEWAKAVFEKLENVIQIVSQFTEVPHSTITAGRPAFPLPKAVLEELLSFKFSAVDIAQFLGVSRETIFRRLREYGISVRGSYSAITDDELRTKVCDILANFPNTGYKRMKGFLLTSGIKVTDARVRETMRQVDPVGVHFRTLSNRAIVRRQYNVTYFNELWHLDTNMKLIRWNIVIRSCMDGKSRLVTYLDASSDNTAESNLISFVKAVDVYGIPSRTRSDKGGENVLIAHFMIEQRGTNRGSHIWGRSVHNQRIERFWRDVFYGYAGTMYNVFSALENDGILDIDNRKHLRLLHMIFLPRINSSLEWFRKSWNNHPLSSENNYSPNQLMLRSLPPRGFDLPLSSVDQPNVHFLCNIVQDAEAMSSPNEQTITTPEPLDTCLSEQELQRLEGVDINRPSSLLGYDVFEDAVKLLDEFQ